jgi:putative transposase
MIGENKKERLLDKFSFEANRTRRAENYKEWREENHAFCLGKKEWVLQRLNYIHQNPVRQMIVQYPHEYLFSSAMDYNDGKGIVKITKIQA